MMQSPFTFYRGSAAVMAADLATTAQSGLRVQACGDAHLLNFGGFATPERQIVFDINDLDETLPAPWEWDVKRLTASVVIAGQYLRLSETESAHAAEATVRAYREHMNDYSSMRALEVWYDKIGVEDAMAAVDEERRQVMKQRVEKETEKSSPEFVFPKLVEHRGAEPRFKDDPPLIFHPSAELAPGVTTGFREPLARYRASLPDHVRVLFDRYRLCDIAIKVVGIGSVGTMCCIGLFIAAEDDPLFLQVKEARPSVLEPYAGKGVYEHQGQRVVCGQRLMQSASDVFLGWSTGVNGRECLRAPTPRRQNFGDHRGLGRRYAAGVSGNCARGRWRRRMPGQAMPRRSRATWARVPHSMTRSASSRWNTPTRTSGTIVRSSRRSGRGVCRRALIYSVVWRGVCHRIGT